MKKIFGFSTFLLVVFISSLQTSMTSCKKETIRDTVIVTDTLTIIDTLTIKDTVEVVAVDTVFPMNVNAWDGFSFNTEVQVAPGAGTYSNSAEGILLKAQAHRRGLRIQTKKEVGITGKTLYFKWKANGGGDFSDFVPQLKYDPTTIDYFPPVMNVDFHSFTIPIQEGNSTVIQNNTWYYTRMAAIAGTDKYTFVTATGNYDNNGGAKIVEKEVTIYTKHGYLGIRLGDTHSVNATLVLGEYRIASN